tara:strand:- start:910 stop:1407 length:498 start_codon:yes stop_codon:yes gene_type:complete
MKVVDIADEIYRELNSPTDLSVSAIAFWIRTNIGELNNLLFATYNVDGSSLELLDEDDVEITFEAVSVMKKMYSIHYYDLQIRKNITSLSTDTILEVSDQGSSVKKVNKNEISKTLASLRNQEVTSMRNLITAYRLKRAEPRQVAGDDDVAGDYGNEDSTRVADI